jgi:hypothetical protein
MPHIDTLLFMNIHLFISRNNMSKGFVPRVGNTADIASHFSSVANVCVITRNACNLDVFV